MDKKTDKKQEMLNIAFDALKRELGKEPLSPDTVTVLTETIKVLTEINPLSQL